MKLRQTALQHSFICNDLLYKKCVLHLCQNAMYIYTVLKKKDHLNNIWRCSIWIFWHTKWKHCIWTKFPCQKRHAIKLITLRIIGPSYGGVRPCIAGFWDLQTTGFEIPWFLGQCQSWCTYQCADIQLCIWTMINHSVNGYPSIFWNYEWTNWTNPWEKGFEAMEQVNIPNTQKNTNTKKKKKILTSWNVPKPPGNITIRIIIICVRNPGYLFPMNFYFSSWHLKGNLHITPSHQVNQRRFIGDVLLKAIPGDPGGVNEMFGQTKKGKISFQSILNNQHYRGDS